MKKAFISALRDVKQATIDAWVDSVKTLISDADARLKQKEEDEQKRQQLLPYLKEATQKGVTLRELSEVTGLSHTTIARWLNPEKYHYKRKKRVQPDAK